MEGCEWIFALSKSPIQDLRNSIKNLKSKNTQLEANSHHAHSSPRSASRNCEPSQPACAQMQIYHEQRLQCQELELLAPRASSWHLFKRSCEKYGFNNIEQIKHCFNT